jgi:hypothetical protein
MHRPETVTRALWVVKGFGPQGCKDREFSGGMWPYSKGWARPSKVPRDGETHGAVMVSAGAAYLGRLREEGWVARVGDRYVLTAAGEEFLATGGQCLRRQNEYGYATLPQESSHVGASQFQVRWDGSQYIVWNGFAWVPWHP